MTYLLPTISLILAAADLPGQVFDRVAAVVNGEVVTLSELEERAGDMQRASIAKGVEPAKARTQALQTAFDQVIAEKLLSAQVAALQLEVTDTQIDAAIEDIKHRNNFSSEQLEEALAGQGLTRESFRKNIKRDLEIFQILNLKVRSRVKITDEDVKGYYQAHPGEFEGDEQVRVRHIFLALSKSATPAEEARVKGEAEKVLQRIRAGGDFGKLARELSQGPSAADGGELGWLKRGVIQPELENAAFALSAGQVSSVIKTRAGFHIIKVEERRTGQPRPFDEVKEDIRNRLMTEQIESYRGQYVAELKKDATIDIRIPELSR